MMERLQARMLQVTQEREKKLKEQRLESREWTMLVSVAEEMGWLLDPLESMGESTKELLERLHQTTALYGTDWVVTMAALAEASNTSIAVVTASSTVANKISLHLFGIKQAQKHRLVGSRSGTGNASRVRRSYREWDHVSYQDRWRPKQRVPWESPTTWAR